MAERVVVITGAGSGIGRSTAVKFARKGDKIVVADFNEKGGQETVDMIKAANGEATFVKVDVSKFDQVEAMVEKSIELYGSLDVVFNNAGIGKIIPFLDYTVEDYERVIGVNQNGVFYGMLAAGRKMRDLGVKGVIINTASVFGYLSNQYTFAYQASKGAVRMMCQTGALELAPYGIRVVGVAPGTVDTPIVQGFKDAGLTDKLKSNQMRGDLIQPEAIANAVYLLSLEEADVINGSVVMLDDGYASFK
ncbi:SDR family oxidoreductase [Viridibacillus sp. YIM B01967]|uniref:SDR family oxidoreductase n=1 Tax=Viridibacillus soli TaxID=2798301 RepID=A0ABS1H551_9BACL|nr:SDR family oxidoreductase [Viridibacillus soli]MBK3494540.1 SDR family oxidoreductase [Viridibacillus soli]